MLNAKIAKRERRRKKVRSKIHGSSSCPRLSVFRSNRFIYAQLIDDIKGRTLISCDDHHLKDKSINKKDRAAKIGKILANMALKKGIKRVVFDRNGYKYHGRIKELAEAARKGGLKF